MAAPKGNNYAREWTLENALPRFEDALEYARTNEACLCIQDAIAQTGIPYSTFDYLANNQEVLRTIKESIKAEVIRRINRFALDKLTPCPASPAIWRMKQLGERDEQHINTTGTTKTEISVTSKEAQKEVDKLIKKFEDE
jgi:hypothetical protein